MPGVDDVLDEQHVPALHVDGERRDGNFPVADRRRPEVRRRPDGLDEHALGRRPDGAHEVRGEHERAGHHGQQDGLQVRVVRRDLRPEFSNLSRDRVFVQDDLQDVDVALWDRLAGHRGTGHSSPRMMIRGAASVKRTTK